MDFDFVYWTIYLKNKEFLKTFEGNLKHTLKEYAIIDYNLQK